MVTIASGFGKKLNVINERTLGSSDGINGASVADQRLWALSQSEWNAIGSDTVAVDVKKYPSSWWLRSPGYYDDTAFAGSSGGGGNGHDYVDFSAFVVRPAFNLNLESVLFTSESSNTAGVGKSAAAAGGGYKPLAEPSAARKFTFLDKTISTPELTLTSSALDFDYSVTPVTGAPSVPGGEKYVSGFLYNASASSDNDSYAKYADTTASPNGSFNVTNPSGSSPLATDDNYTLHIFSEEANTYLHSDFASQSVDFTFTMSNGNVKDLTLTSNSAFGLDGGSIALGSGETFDQAWSLANGSALDASNATAFTPSSLNVHGKDNAITGDLDATGSALNFYLPTANGTMLNVTGTATITNSVIDIIGQPVLHLGDYGTLMNKTTGTPATALGNNTYPDTTSGATYGFNLGIDASNLTFIHNSVNAVHKRYI
ncbi:hypothetical protein AGMMS50256_31630 [Betaproteobacteria bacterium]|nr:hypothetical protein AGMMS50256_31630 [Betaproteobacteria bacterium]